MSFANRKEFGERCYDQVFAVMAQILGRESTPMEDMSRGVDLVMAPAGISVRIRRPKYIPYRGEFTIRLNPNEDGKTELDKLLRPPESGLRCSHMFYGFSQDSEGRELGHWSVLDMDLFAGTDVRGVEKYHSGGEKFIVFKIEDFTKDLIVAEGFADGITYRRTRKRPDGQCD